MTTVTNNTVGWTRPPRSYLEYNSAGVNPTATDIDCVLAVYELPAGTLDVENRTLKIMAQGTFAGGEGASSDIQIVFNPTSATVGDAVSGGTVISGQGGITDGAGNWIIEADVVKTGASGSNTQLALVRSPIVFQGEFSVTGNSFGIYAPQELTATESDSILIAVTGNSMNNTSEIALTLFQVTVE